LLAWNILTELQETSPAPADAAVPRKLGVTAVRAFFYTGGQALFVRILSLIGFIVLARLLTPKDYGVVALANVFQTVLATFAAAGVSPTLLQKTDIDETETDSAFWAGLALGTTLAVVLVGASWPIANVFGEPQLRPILQVLSITFLFTAIGSVPQALLARRLDFRSIAIATTVANVFATIIGVAFAFAGLGVWSLVIQSVLGIAVLALIMFRRSGFRPGLRFSLARARSILRTSSAYAGNGLADLFSQQSGSFAVGAALGSVSLGYYAVASRILVILVEVLSLSVLTVAFPMFARVKEDPVALKRAYLTASRLSAAVSAPVYLLTLAVAPEAVVAAFGEKWRASVPIMQILCLFGPVYSVMVFNGAVLQALGRPAVVFKITLYSTLAQAVALVFLAGRGLDWVAVIFVARLYIAAPIEMRIACKAIGVDFRQPFLALMPSAVAAAAMINDVIAVRHLVGADLGTWPRLLLLTLVGLLTYVAVLAIVGRDQFLEVKGLLRRAYIRSDPSA
jgi:O-antigen/teichoic acid export membrane protein